MNYERFPWGKYKGTPINELEPTYIAYALKEFDLPDELKESLINELLTQVGAWDFIGGIHPTDVYAAFKIVSLKYDTGKTGSADVMRAINEFKSLLV